MIFFQVGSTHTANRQSSAGRINDRSRLTRQIGGHRRRSDSSLLFPQGEVHRADGSHRLRGIPIGHYALYLTRCEAFMRVRASADE